VIVRNGVSFSAFLLLSFAGGLKAQDCAPGALRVIVLDSQEGPVFNAGVSLSAPTASANIDRFTQSDGVADLQGIPCVTWTMKVSAGGFEPFTRTIEAPIPPNTVIRVILAPKSQNASVDVKDTVPGVEQTASENHELKPAEVKKLPTNPATVADILPLVPGVVRGQDGDLKIDGSGQERSAMVVNQTDITDPATGRFGQTLPIDSIETVNVLQTPFLAQYGRFTQSVVAVETQRGGEKWHAELNDPFPDFRIRSYHMRGIRDASPRFIGGGPVLRNRLYLIAAVQYNFNRDSNRTLPFPFNESRRESWNSFTQSDLILSPRLIITSTLHVSPQHTNFVNPDYFNPQIATPSFAQHNYNGTSIAHLGVLGGILDSSISVQRFDVTVGSQGPADMLVTPTGNRGNFFGGQNRSARRTEWLETWSLAPIKFVGTHLIKMGSSLTGTGNEGQFTYRSANILDDLGRIRQRIAFTNQSPFNRTDTEVTAYVQDHWSLAPTFAVDYGGRVEHQRLATSLRVAPRAGFAWSPFGQRSVLRAGYGLFYDHLPLDIYTFARYPLRTITDYAPDGSIIGTPVENINVIGDSRGPRSFFVNGRQVAGAFSPRGSTLNLQVEASVTKWFRLRGEFLDNQSVGLIVLEPGQLGTTNEIVLNGDGKSRYRQGEITARFSWKDEQQINVSYTRSRAEGSLNTFDSFLGNFPTLLVRPNLRSRLPADLPNRILAWGHVKTHIWNLELNPILEFRSGFPYAALDEAQNYAGIPYRDSTRYPNFFSADARVLRDFKVSPKYTVRLSWTGTNLTNHFNALAVHNNIADAQYGVFFGNYIRRHRGDFEIIF
jgi:hypothetical protein